MRASYKIKTFIDCIIKIPVITITNTGVDFNISQMGILKM